MEHKFESNPSIPASLLAYLDSVILHILTRRPMNGYEINTAIIKFGVIVGPSTVYSKLSNMERKGWISTIQENPDRVYVLTKQGQQEAENINGST